MARSRSSRSKVLSVAMVRRQDTMAWWAGYLVCIVLALAVGAIAVGTAPKPMSIAVLLMIFGAVVVVIRPVLGIYLTVFLAIIGDGVTSAWYPFTKGFSSPESILFISRKVIGSPLELYLVLLVLGWVLLQVAGRQWHVVHGRFFWPLMAFTAFLFVGFGYGISRGGSKNIALWEIRPILYLALLYFLVTNIFRRREQYQRLYWAIMAATAINAVVALIFRRTLTKAKLASMESLVQHGSTLPMNAMFVFIAGAWLFRGASRAKRLALPIMALPVVVVYLLSQRRAAIVALIAAVLVLFAVLFRTHRRAFFRLAPAVLVIGGLYTAAFWNASGSLGFPAQAVKSVIAPGSLSTRDQSSDYYRVVETADVLYTIHSSPLVGIGFGQKFYRPTPLPEISSFLLSEYISHNSVLWIWMKAGIGGFLAMLYLFGTVMRVGARTALGTSDGDDAALTLTSVAFVLMYAVFTYVDIAWDAKSMVFLAVAMAQIASVERGLASNPESPPTPVVRELVPSAR